MGSKSIKQPTTSPYFYLMLPKFPFHLAVASKPGGPSKEAEVAVRKRWRPRSKAHRFEAHPLRYITSVTSKTNPKTLKTTCSNFSPRLILECLIAISGTKDNSKVPSFPGSSLLSDMANHNGYYLRFYLSQATRYRSTNWPITKHFPMIISA